MFFKKKPTLKQAPTIDSIDNKIAEVYEDMITLEERLNAQSKADEERIAKLQDSINARNAQLKYIANQRASVAVLVEGK